MRLVNDAVIKPSDPCPLFLLQEQADRSFISAASGSLIHRDRWRSRNVIRLDGVHLTDHVCTFARGNKGKDPGGGGEEKVGSFTWVDNTAIQYPDWLVTLSVKNSLTAAATSDDYRSSPCDVDLQAYSPQLSGREISFHNRTDCRDCAIIVPSLS